MQKAHLYEAIHLVNRGIDDAVRGLERLKRAKDSGLKPGYLDEKLTLFELHRALLNSFFCNNVEVANCGTNLILQRGIANTKRGCWTKCKSTGTYRR